MLCESCEQRPASRAVAFTDGGLFAVCQSCAPLLALPPVLPEQLALVAVTP